MATGDEISVFYVDCTQGPQGTIIEGVNVRPQREDGSVLLVGLQRNTLARDPCNRRDSEHPRFRTANFEWHEAAETTMTALLSSW